MSVKKKIEPEIDIMNEINRVPMTQESRQRMSLNIYDLQYLIRLQDLSNDAFKQTFNEEWRKDVAKMVAGELAEVLSPIYLKLQELADGQKAIADDITLIKKRLDIMEEQVNSDKKEIVNIYKRLDCEKKKIEELETTIKSLQLVSIERLLRKAIRINSFWNIVLRIISGVIIGIISMWFILRYWWTKLF